MQVTKVSQFSGQTHTRKIDITPDQLRRFNQPQRPHIQDLFPWLSADDREFLLTGITPEEWDEMMPKEEN